MTTTLLCVDDSRTIRKALEITFGGEDVRTILAQGADDALSKLASERPSIALVDAGLEGGDGYELCQRIKAAAAGTGVILLTSRHQPYESGRGSAAGADDYIDKPFDTQQLIDKVAALTRKLANQARPAAPAPAPAPAGVFAPQPIMAPSRGAYAEPALPEGRQRAPTLTYGSQPVPAPSPSGQQPIAPVIPRSVVHASDLAPVPVVAPAPAPAVARPSAPETATAAAFSGVNGASLGEKLGSLGLTPEQVTGVLALSREVVEQVVWEVVPLLAETLIQEELARLTRE